MHDLPLRVGLGHRVAAAVGVEALVDDAEEAQARVRQRRLLGGFGSAGRGGLREMRRVHAAGKAVHVRVAVLLRPYRLGPPVNTTSALVSSALSRCSNCGGAILERRQLVHAVVDDGPRPQLARASGSAIGV